MKPGLLLVDLQHDFLAREALTPGPLQLVERIERLLRECRAASIPVFHAHTRVRVDGSDRMPHWQRDGTWACVEGTPGASSPERLRPTSDEPVFFKQFFSAFGSQTFPEALRKAGIDTLIVAGLYLHGCVRSTVLDAYERGYEVWIVDDAVGSTEADHAEITRIYLEGRAAVFLDTEQVLERLGVGTASRRDPAVGEQIPVANCNAHWVAASQHSWLEHRNPSNSKETIAHIPIARHGEIAAASKMASKAQRDWCLKPAVQRAEAIAAWADAVAERTEALTHLLALEIGKPVADGREEVDRAVSLIRATARRVAEETPVSVDGAAAIRVRFRPHGVVGLITPWNNPVMIPVGKIAPALGFGNGALWKPAIEAPRTAMAVMESISKVDVEPGLLGLVFGDASTARQVVAEETVAAVSLTGSVESGASVAARCTRLRKPLQAELGGNNAAIVLRDCDVASEAAGMARAAFSFAGQRCTSIQRFIVERAILEEFERALVAAVRSLRVGDPMDSRTEIGPLISPGHRKRVCQTLERAVSEGARVCCGGEIPPGLEGGSWLTPAVVGDVRSEFHIARREVFGPVAVILTADDLDSAIKVANRVEQGLVAAVYTNNEARRRRFADAAEAGILKLAPGPLAIHPDAPFGGWGASRIGPPEHGAWDRQFYTRPQVTYGASP